MTTQPSTGPRPRDRRLRGISGGYVNDDAVLAIEAEARAAALTAVGEAVREYRLAAPHWIVPLDSVLAVLAKLQEDALHPADKEAETSHE